MYDYYKLKIFMEYVSGVIQSDPLFEKVCELLGGAIGIAGYKLELLVSYDVEDVFPEIRNNIK